MDLTKAWLLKVAQNGVRNNIYTKNPASLPLRILPLYRGLNSDFLISNRSYDRKNLFFFQICRRDEIWGDGVRKYWKILLTTQVQIHRSTVRSPCTFFVRVFAHLLMGPNFFPTKYRESGSTNSNSPTNFERETIFPGARCHTFYFRSIPPKISVHIFCSSFSSSPWSNFFLMAEREQGRQIRISE